MIILDLCGGWRLRYARIDNIHRIRIGPVCVIWSFEYHNVEDLRFAVCDIMRKINNTTGGE